jgi:hypothetical protein
MKKIPYRSFKCTVGGQTRVAMSLHKFFIAVSKGNIVDFHLIPENGSDEVKDAKAHIKKVLK